MSKQKFDLKSLDFNNIGGWPRNAQLVFCAVLALLIVVVAWFLLISGKRDELNGLEQQEAKLRSDFEDRAGRTANLEPLKQQLTQMEQVLQQMLRQLPSKTEMPDLITDVSQTALSSGLTNDLFKPGPEVKRDFYAEEPIALRMVGTYHQFGAFVSGVASLPRVVILTMHDITLKPAGNSGGLELAGTVKTYRYLDDEEMDDAKGKKAAGKGGKK